MTPELLHRALREAGLATDDLTVLLDRLYALQRNQPYRWAFTTRLQAAGWAISDIAQALDQVAQTIEQLRAQGVLTTEEIQERQLAEAHARREAERAVIRRRLEELQEDYKRLLPIIAKMGQRRLTPQERTVAFLTTCHLLKYKHRARRELLRLAQESWQRPFTVADLMRRAGCSRTYALKIISYGLRLKVLTVATPGSRGRGRATTYCFTYALKNVTSCNISNQSKEHIACATLSGLGEGGGVRGSGSGAQLPASQQLSAGSAQLVAPQRKRNCKRVKYYIEACSPIVYNEPVKYRYPFWRDFLYGTRIKLLNAGFTPEQAQTVACLAAHWITGRTIIRAYEFLTQAISALCLLPPHKRTTRRLLWTTRYYYVLVFLRTRLQGKWYIDITPEKRREIERRKQLREQTRAQHAVPQTNSPTNNQPQQVQQPSTNTMPRNRQTTTPDDEPQPLPPDARVRVYICRDYRNWEPAGECQATFDAILHTLIPYMPDIPDSAIHRALLTPGKPVLAKWMLGRTGEGALPVYILLRQIG
jgi:hypothetical protein